MEVRTIFLDFFITVIAYLLVPTILCICRKKITLPKIITIVIINGICVWLIFMIIRINAGLSGTSAAVFLWSTVAFFLMKKRCLKDSDNSKPIKEPVITEIEEVDLANIKTQKPKKKKQPLIFVTIALVVLLIVSVTYNIIQYTTIQKCTEGIKYLEENVLPEYIIDNEEEIASFSEWVNSKYNYDYKTHKYLDLDGNEYKNQNTRQELTQNEKD